MGRVIIVVVGNLTLISLARRLDIRHVIEIIIDVLGVLPVETCQPLDAAVGLGLEAVSYTHLDVYKRQIVNTGPQP